MNWSTSPSQEKTRKDKKKANLMKVKRGKANWCLASQWICHCNAKWHSQSSFHLWSVGQVFCGLCRILWYPLRGPSRAVSDISRLGKLVEMTLISLSSIIFPSPSPSSPLHFYISIPPLTTAFPLPLHVTLSLGLSMQIACSASATKELA